MTFFMNNAAFGKTMENVGKQRDIKFVTKERRNYLVRTKLSHFKVLILDLLAIEMRKTQIFINKPVYLGLPILKLTKKAMYEFWYDYVKPQHGGKAKLCYM